MDTKDSSLPQPRVPAFDDGIIDATDMASGTILVIIGYSNMKAGDFVKIYMNTDEVSDYTVTPEDEETLINIYIKSSSLHEGSNTLSYISTDDANNTRNSKELYLYVNSGSDIEKLAPPSIIYGEDGCLTLEEIQEQDGVIVSIKPSTDFNKYLDDELYVCWTEYDSAGIPIAEGQIVKTYAINKEMVNSGISFRVQSSTVLLANNGSVITYYYIDVGAERVYSSECKVSIGNCNSKEYSISLNSDKSEVLDNGTDYATLTATVVDEQGNVVPGQTINWTTSLNQLGKSTTVTDDKGASTDTLLGQTKGTATVVATLALEQDKSASVDINFTDSANNLPPPVFTQANSGVILSEQINNDNGVMISVSYRTIKINDVITLNITGKFSNGTEDNQAESEQTHTVTAADVKAGSYTFTLSKDQALSVEDNGLLNAVYSVSNAQGNNNSPVAEVRVDMSNDKTLSCWMTTGAPVYDPARLQLSPSNKAKLLGPPGANIEVSCSEGAIIVESDATKYVLTLNEEGVAYFSVRSTITGVITINAYQMHDPSVSFTGQMHFDDYAVGISPFYAYAYTTGAVADNSMPCSLYIVTDPQSSLSEVRVYIRSDDVEIIGFSNPAIIPLHPDHSIEVDIVCGTAVNVTAEVTLPESSGSKLDFDLAFR